MNLIGRFYANWKKNLKKSWDVGVTLKDRKTKATLCENQET